MNSDQRHIELVNNGNTARAACFAAHTAIRAKKSDSRAEGAWAEIERFELFQNWTFWQGAGNTGANPQFASASQRVNSGGLNQDFIANRHAVRAALPHLIVPERRVQEFGSSRYDWPIRSPSPEALFPADTPGK